MAPLGRSEVNVLHGCLEVGSVIVKTNVWANTDAKISGSRQSGRSTEAGG